MARKCNVGMIGTGGISATHIPGWADSEHAELVAGADLREDALQAWGKRHGIGRLTIDPQELINDPNIDVIDICVPNNYHAPLAIAALDAGKHVICEKPLAPKPDQIRQMIEARDRSGKLLMTAQHFRFQGVSRALKAEINAGVLGRVYHARGWMLRRAGMVPTANFTLKERAGGGPCIDIGVHILDLALWLMGNPRPVTVSGTARCEIAHHEGAFTNWGPGQAVDCPYDVEDFAAAFVRFENGASLVLEVSWFLHHDTPTEDMQLWLYGTDAGMHWPSCQVLSTNYERRQFNNSTLQMVADEAEPHAAECMAFARAVVDGGPSPVPAEQSLQVMSILDALYQSQETGAEVRLDV